MQPAHYLRPCCPRQSGGPLCVPRANNTHARTHAHCPAGGGAHPAPAAARAAGRAAAPALPVHDARGCHGADRHHLGEPARGAAGEGGLRLRCSQGGRVRCGQWGIVCVHRGGWLLTCGTTPPLALAELDGPGGREHALLNIQVEAAGVSGCSAACCAQMQCLRERGKPSTLCSLAPDHSP